MQTSLMNRKYSKFGNTYAHELVHIPGFQKRRHSVRSFSFPHSPNDSHPTKHRPGSISAMAAVRLLRKNGSTLSNANLLGDDNDFSAWSWPRSEEGMEGYRESIYEQNRQTLSEAIWGNLHDWKLRDA